TRPGGVSAGRPGDPHLRGQGRPDRSARGHAPRLDGRGTHEARCGSGDRHPCDRAHRARPQARGLDCRPEEPDRLAAKRGGGPQRSCDRRHLGGARYGRDRRHRRDAGTPSRPEDPSAGFPSVTGLNLSEWALKHRSFTVYCMIALMIVGAMSYYRLGRNEDPAFTFRTMVVQAAWPGATLQETLDQVTERIERTLQETPSLDFLRSYTRAGVTTIFVTLKGSTPAREVPDLWYHVRKSVGDMRHTLPSGVVGPGFNDEFGDTFGIIYGFTADGFTHRELRDYVENVRSRLLRVADV